MIPEIQKFREKYPDYSDIDDVTLASKLATKYPDAYGDLPGKVQAETAPVAKAEDPGFLSRVGEAWKQRVPKIMADPTNPVRMFGQGAGALNDVVAEGARSIGKGVWNTLDPAGQEALKGAGKYILESRPGKAIIGGLGAAQEGWKGFKEKAPELATDLESAGNIVTLLPTGAALKGTGKLVKEGAATIGDVKRYLIPKTIGGINNDIKSTVKVSLQKAGIKPKPSMTIKSDKFYDKAARGAERIVERVKANNELEIPRNLEGFQRSVSTAKQLEIDDIKGALEKAGKHEISTRHQVDAIDEWLKSDIAKGIEAKTPNVIKEANELRETLVRQKFYTPGELNESITGYNEILRILYQSPDPKTHNLKGLYTKLADIERKVLDKTIEELNSPGFDNLKKNWGALKEIEGRVAQKASREAGKGKVTAWDTVLGSVGISALLHANPQLLTTAILATGAKQGLRYLRSPDRIVKNMFKDVEKLFDEKVIAGSFHPKSAAGRLIDRKTAERSNYTQPGASSPYVQPGPSSNWTQPGPSSAYPRGTLEMPGNPLLMEKNYIPGDKSTKGTIEIPSGLMMEKDFVPGPGPSQPYSSTFAAGLQAQRQAQALPQPVNPNLTAGQYPGAIAGPNQPYSASFAGQLQGMKGQKALPEGQGFELGQGSKPYQYSEEKGFTLVSPETTKPTLTPKIEGPKSGLVQWIKDRGGIYDKSLPGEMEQFGGREAKSVALINKNTGRPFDDLAKMAIDDGWLPEGAGARDLIDLIGQDLRALRAKKPELRPTAGTDQAVGRRVESQIMAEEAAAGDWATELTKSGYNYLGPRNTMAAAQLEIPGTKAVINGEKYTSKGIVGNKVILKDGETIKADLFDDLPVEAVKKPGVLGKLIHDKRGSFSNKPNYGEVSRSAEDFEINPKKMRDLKPGMLAFKDGSNIISAKIGSKINGVVISNHADLGIAKKLNFDKAIPGFLDTKGNFVK